MDRHQPPSERCTLTSYFPTPAQVQGTDDPDEMALTWTLTGCPNPGGVGKH